MPPTYNTFGDIPNPPRGAARVAVATAFWTGGGRRSCAEGPARILAASAYMELYDEELDRQAADFGLHTVPEPLAFDRGGEGEQRERLLALWGENIFTVLLGDDLRVSSAAMKAARLHEPAVQPVLLSGSSPPADFWSAIQTDPGMGVVRLLALKDPPKEPPPGSRLLAPARLLMEDRDLDPWEDLSEVIYLSVHPDFLEPAVLPGPGNLEPGGLDWWRTIDILRLLFARHRVVGIDLCGFRPGKGSVISDFTLAKLLYKAIGYRLFLSSFSPIL